MRDGYRGYIFARSFMGERAPQHVQNLVIRDYAARNKLAYKLSATEYTMNGCHMMLEQVLDELPSLQGMICYSVFQLPTSAEARKRVYARVIAAGAELHAALEELVVRTEADARRVEDIWKVREALDACPTEEQITSSVRIDPQLLSLRRAADGDCDAMWALRNHPTARPMFLNSDEIELDAHRRWYKENVVSGRSILYMAFLDDVRVGYIRFALAPGKDQDISFIVDPAQRGRGIGTAMLSAACSRFFADHPTVNTVTTSVASDNPRSYKAFRTCGFSETAAQGRFHYNLSRHEH